jgi:hypothetical protein
MARLFPPPRKLTCAPDFKIAHGNLEDRNPIRCNRQEWRGGPLLSSVKDRFVGVK